MLRIIYSPHNYIPHCGDDIDIIERPAAFALRSKHEDEREVQRLIILPPRGYTANTLEQTNSHDEAERATIEIKGAVREGKKGFSRLRDSLLVVSCHENGSVSELNQPYLTFDMDGEDEDFVRELHSAGESPFPVVKSDGYGFYHNLINVTDDWQVLVLRKKLRPQRQPDFAPHFATLQNEHAIALQSLYDGIVEHGDEVFTNAPQLVDGIMKLPPKISLPSLGEMLYVHDTGRHEACTAFAVILKLGKIAPETVTEFLQESLESKAIPSYYAKQLIGKINRSQDDKPASGLSGGHFALEGMK